MARILQTFILPEALVAKHNLSFAAVNFSKNLISGKGFNRVFSLIPTNVRGKLFGITETGYEVIYSSLRCKGAYISKLASFSEQWTLFRKIHHGDYVWFYNLNMINGLLFVLLMLFKPSVKRNIIVLDFTPADSWRDQNYWFLKLINKAHGIICLSTSDLFTVKNKAILPGVVPASLPSVPEVTEYKREFLISGVLSENISMLRELLIPAFKKLDSCKLHITGNIDNETELTELIKDNKNIIYHGKVSMNEYFNILHNVPFLLSTRNPVYPENQCNFPSKIIEALLHNRIIVSTLHYTQLDNIKYFEVAHNIDDFIRDVDGISSMPKETLSLYSNQSKIVAQRFSTEVWNDTMTRIEECK